MKVFSSLNPKPNPRPTPGQKSTHSRNQGRRGGIRHFRERKEMDLSADDIRKKLAQNSDRSVSISKGAKAKAQNVENEEKEVAAASEIGFNDPNDPTTREKLKSILRSGGFDFSERERNVLDQILQE